MAMRMHAMEENSERLAKNMQDANERLTKNMRIMNHNSSSGLNEIRDALKMPISRTNKGIFSRIKNLLGFGFPSALKL
jgi:hypothetical protein